MTHARSPISSVTVGVVVVVAVLAASACSSSHHAGSLGSHLRLLPTTTAASAIGNPHAPLAQFTPAEARRLPAPFGADAAALVALSRGAPPTLDEILAAQHGMDGTLATRSAPRVLPADVRAELAGAESAAKRYPTAADAARAGYRLASRFLPGIGSHWIKWRLVTAPFDPAQPSMLLYDGDGPSARLAGLSYYTESASPPAAFTAGGAVWHRHIGLCIVHGVLVAEGVTSRAACAHGLLLPGRNIWMLHVWVRPGLENRDGTFAPVNPALCSTVAPCAAPLK